MSTISFIILHYKGISDTFECVDSIEKLDIENSNIIVVENGASESDIEKLKLLEVKKNIKVLYNNYNYGFAKGNNIGIRYAKEKFNPDYYFVLNNDTIISPGDILEKIDNAFSKNNFDVCGPQILDRNKNNQNPNYNVLVGEISIIKHIIKMSILSTLNFIGVYDFLLKKKKNKNKTHTYATEKIQIGVPLHGSALIFSSNYVNCYKYPFSEKTFLYGEEEFLFYRKNRDNLTFLYLPTVKILHKEDGSLNAMYNSERRKRAFVLKHGKKSLIQLLRVMYSDKRSN